MQVEELSKAYQTKTDEELLQLATHAGQLTPEAQTALMSELARRRIDSSEYLKRHGEKSDRFEEPKAREMSASDSRGIGGFVEELLGVYRAHFWLFIKLVVPSVVVGYIAVQTGRNEARDIARHLPRGFSMLGHQTEILEIWLANLAGYLVSWIAFSFSFGAICSAVRQISRGLVPTVQDSFAEVRDRRGSFLQLSLLLFLLLLLLLGVALLVSTGLLWLVHQRQLHLSRFVIQAVSFGSVGLALLVLSRFGLAIPALVLDDCRVGQAVFRSDELTEGKWLVLAVLLAKSLVGGYVAGMCPFWLASFILGHASSPSWLPWTLIAASIAGVAVVEPTMFIGFALLYSTGVGTLATLESTVSRQPA